MTLKVGNLVKLKSGGPTMTVSGIPSDGAEGFVWVSWFDPAHGGQPLNATFHEDALTNIDDAPKPTVSLVA